jgi:hypothetical protein
MSNDKDNADKDNADSEFIKKVILDMHIVYPGIPGMLCCAGIEPEDGYTREVGHVVICTACGNELDRSDQLRVKVWDDERHRTRNKGTAHLEFVG